ncbi:hypothetical protein ONE63_008186 [Megalurothrips usitatus]|uniref:Transposable element P transposase-like RNase H domain-containing protein n=1 Tax=Megalurothrips usitatus TaxID=439358 RepID=A0AAV7XKD1_9NEOP|nr:hypothetical protein ONE63_008186 [Megalurothrips usitatus]
MKDLPKPQQEAVHAMIRAAKMKGPQGNRFTVEWVYECILLRIKGPANYEHLKEQEIFPLPCRTTLNRYMRKLPSVYGFQLVLFDVLKHKLESMPSADKHRKGNLVIDEMMVTIGVSFDRHTKKTIGLVDLGKFTPEKDNNKPEDHILEILFQSFRGGWVQSLGIFLTNSNCKGDVLPKIIIEATTLSENAGLFVDGIVTDAATWNRVMWSQFGIDSTNSSCDHPVRQDDRLHFFSDWSHIMKCARNVLSPELHSKPEASRPKTRKRKIKDTAGNEMSEEQIYEMKVQSALNKEIDV